MDSIKKLPDGTLSITSMVTIKGKQIPIFTYDKEGNGERLIAQHIWNLEHSDIVYYQTLQMHKEIASGQNSINGDWPEDMKKVSRKWLSKYGLSGRGEKVN